MCSQDSDREHVSTNARYSLLFPLSLQASYTSRSIHHFVIVGQAPYPHTCTFIKYDSHEDLARRPFLRHTYPLPSARSSRLLRWSRSIQHPRMTELLILVPPCIALMTPIMSPAFSVSVVLALAVTQSILTTLLWLHVWKMSDDDDEARAGAGADDEYESDAVIEDATNTIHAAFAVLAKSPAATSTFFHVVKWISNKSTIYGWRSETWRRRWTYKCDSVRRSVLRMPVQLGRRWGKAGALARVLRQALYNVQL